MKTKNVVLAVLFALSLTLSAVASSRPALAGGLSGGVIAEGPRCEQAVGCVQP